MDVNNIDYEFWVVIFLLIPLTFASYPFAYWTVSTMFNTCIMYTYSVCMHVCSDDGVRWRTETDRRADRLTDRLTSRQAGRQTDRQAEADRQAE